MAVAGDAAILLWEPETQQPDLRGARVQRARKLLSLVPFRGERRDLGRDEAAHGFAERAVRLTVMWGSMRHQAGSLLRGPPNAAATSAGTRIG